MVARRAFVAPQHLAADDGDPRAVGLLGPRQEAQAPPHGRIDARVVGRRRFAGAQNRQERERAHGAPSSGGLNAVTARGEVTKTSPPATSTLPASSASRSAPATRCLVRDSKA